MLISRRYLLLIFSMLMASSSTMAQGKGCGNICELYSSLILASERALIGSIRTLEQVARPVVGPRNTRGRWMQREVYLGTEPFDTTFYFRSDKVERIELVSAATKNQCRARVPWTGAIAALEGWLGKEAVKGEFSTENSAHQSMNWAAGDVDVSIYLSTTEVACSTKVALKKREVKHASEL